MNNQIQNEGSPEIAGTWRPFKAELAGELAPEMVLSRTELFLSETRYAVRFDRQISDEGVYVVETTATPHRLTLTGEQGPNQGRIIPAIYQQTGGRLRICYGLDGVLPTEFAAPSGSQRYLVTYRRSEKNTPAKEIA